MRWHRPDPVATAALLLVAAGVAGWVLRGATQVPSPPRSVERVEESPEEPEPVAPAPPDEAVIDEGAAEFVERALASLRAVESAPIEVLAVTIGALFDMETFMPLALGHAWSTLSAARRERVTADGRSILARLAARESTRWLRPSTHVVASAVDGGKTQVTLSSIEGAKLDLIVRRGAGGWKIADVEIDEISIASIWRRSIERRFEAGEIDAESLLARMERKLQELRANPHDRRAARPAPSIPR